jgi:hypothetical protein
MLPVRVPVSPMVAMMVKVLTSCPVNLPVKALASVPEPLLVLVPVEG